MKRKAVNRYITRIRNPLKRAYALGYSYWLTGMAERAPQRPVDLSYMAAQAVEMELRDLYGGTAFEGRE